MKKKKMSKAVKEILEHEKNKKNFQKILNRAMKDPDSKITTKFKAPKPIIPLSDQSTDIERGATVLMNTIKTERYEDQLRRLMAEMAAVKGAISVVVGNLQLYKLILEKKVTDKALIDGVVAIENLLKLTVGLSDYQGPEKELQQDLNHLGFSGMPE